MTTRSISPVGRAATALVLAGAGLSFSGVTAWADTTVPCGTPAHPALYTTTHHDAVPAVTHEVTVIDQAYVPGEAGVPEESHIETTWVDGDGTPEGEGWSTTGESTVVEDAPAYTDHGWLRTVIDRAGVEGQPAVPAVTHDETVVDKAAWDETVTDSPAKDAVDEVSHFETVVDKAAWDETVVDSPAKDAVEEVSHFETVVDKAAWDETVVDANGYAFTQKNGNVRWEDSATWNAGTGGAGWTRAASLDKTHVVHHDAVTHQEKVIDTPGSPAVPAVTHVVHHDAVTHQVKVIDTPASPAVPAVTHVVHHDAVTSQVKVIDTPASPAVPAVTHVVHHDAVTHTVTVVDAEAVPAVEAVEELSHVETAWTQDVATAPEGEGWVLSGEEVVHDAETHVRYEFTRTVVDVAAVPAVEEVPEVSHTETVVDVPEVAPWDEQVLVSEATPAGAPCPPKVETAVLGETATSNPASVPAQTQSLAHTGSDLVVPLGAGLVLVVVGGALVAAGRRREV
jgi:hypothetical protein